MPCNCSGNLENICLLDTSIISVKGCVYVDTMPSASRWRYSYEARLWQFCFNARIKNTRYDNSAFASEAVHA